MGSGRFRFGLVVSIVFALWLPNSLSAENWVEFHKERWQQKSGKGRKRLSYCNHYFYDSDSVAINPEGDVTLWVREVAENDRFYTKKGAAESEVLYRQVYLWCKNDRYQILGADGEESRANEQLSEEIRQGTYYEKLRDLVCPVR